MTRVSGYLSYHGALSHWQIWRYLTNRDTKLRYDKKPDTLSYAFAIKTVFFASKNKEKSLSVKTCEIAKKPVIGQFHGCYAIGSSAPRPLKCAQGKRRSLTCGMPPRQTKTIQKERGLHA